METSNVKSCSWFPFSDEPLLTGSWYAPRLSNPQVILPSRACDGKWHMFAQDWMGIHHFTSDSGIAWEGRQTLALKSRCPFVYYENETYFLLYETHDLNLPLSYLKDKDKDDHISRIEMITSTDLITWSKPRVILDSRSVPFSGDYVRNKILSNPQLVKVSNAYRLYFGASEVVLQDSKQKFPRYLGCAFSRKIDESYILEKPEAPVLEADPNDRFANLACGSVRVIESDDKIYGFQCCAYWDEQKKRSASVLRILETVDGVKFVPCKKRPVLIPSEEGWTDGYITGCDVRYKADEKCWYCYYSAAGHKSGPAVKESVGLMIGSVPTKSQRSIAQNLNEVLFV